MTWTLHQGDCLEVMRTLPEASVDAVVTDPPYELGFMGKGWDASGVAFRVETWAAALRVLKPGGHLLAFGGTRTYHRMTCAIEDAGFEIRDCIQWLYGTGFPKSLNLGGERDGWGTALKPANEPVVVARKPLSEPTVSANVLRWGTGSLNIDGCRIKGAKPATVRGAGGQHGRFSKINAQGRIEDDGKGRWPANVILDEEAAALLDAQSGESRSTTKGSFQREKTSRGYKGGGFGQQRAKDHPKTEIEKPGYGDSGGASRFFYVAKASKAERGEGNNHPTVKPVALMRYLCRLVTPLGGTVLDPFAGSGTTLLAAVQEGFSVMGIEREPAYCDTIRRRMAALGEPLPLEVAR